MKAEDHGKIRNEGAPWCKTHAIEQAKMLMDEEISFEWNFEGAVGDVFTQCSHGGCHFGPSVTITVDTGIRPE